MIGEIKVIFEQPEKIGFVESSLIRIVDFFSYLFLTMFLIIVFPILFAIRLISNLDSWIVKTRYKIRCKKDGILKIGTPVLVNTDLELVSVNGWHHRIYYTQNNDKPDGACSVNFNKDKGILIFGSHIFEGDGIEIRYFDNGIPKTYYITI